MSIGDRQLEEDEVKIDNLLHKIIEATRKVDILVNSSLEDFKEQIRKNPTLILPKNKIERILLLTETISILTNLADDIDVQDMKLQKEKERSIKHELNKAIENIKSVEELIAVDDK